MVNGVGLVARRLRARREELVEAIFARVREVVPGAVGDRDAEYVAGLRAAVAAAVDYGLVGIERGERGEGWRPVSVPGEVVAQAQRAARNGISLDLVLRRYIVGNALLWDYVMEEADRAEPAGAGGGLRDLLRTQSSLLDELVVIVAREHMGELERAGRSGERRLLERVRMLLAGERVEESELGYQLEGWHVGVIASGADREPLLRELAVGLDCRLFYVECGEGSAWAWLSGRDALEMAVLERALEFDRGGECGGRGDRVSGSGGVSFAVGEPARGLDGWRLTHRQAQAALAVASRRPRRCTRYIDVALLATALKDQALARALLEAYLVPLDGQRDGGVVLRQTLRAYLAAERSISSAAAALGVDRKTIVSRLRTIEQRLGRSLHPWPAELEVALLLDELG